ncbi:MAG: hypothetical protein JW993_08175 [Sedimentisphaerales bacterium]|nr:hypothetical protein [Sedimentisphaerales bacterium]
MRVDLESFVNQGITEGWRGWPVKGPSQCRHEGIRSIYRAAGATGPCHGVLGRRFREDGCLELTCNGRIGNFLP